MTCRPCLPRIINDKGNHVGTIGIGGTMGTVGTIVEEAGIIRGMIVDMVGRALGIIEGDSLSIFLGFKYQ
jgi:hypothetical protein